MVREQEHELETVELNINMGPQHPATHGVFRMVLTVDGERVMDLVPHIGYLHRGAEKLHEAMDYRQGIGFQDRTEYLAGFNAEFCYVMAIEKVAGLEVPERAEYVRVILAELNRVASHYMFMGAFATDIGVLGTAFTYGFREREYIQDLFEEVSGDRLMYGYFRPGGLAWDVPDNFRERVRWVCRQTRVGINDIDRLLTSNEVFVTRCRDIGVISPDEAIDWGLSGPVLRASGVKVDVRREEPYSIYDRFDFEIPVGVQGDSFDRYIVRLEEMRQSVRIIEQAVEQMPEGPILPEKMPRKLRVPEGEVYMRAENPRGEYGIYLVSKGGERPYRLKIRSPCYCNLMALKEMTVGHYVADAVVILGSIDIVLGEVDR
jgi:NADH:ubiquinone oxidoreductase subunit D